jgi:L-asparaginase/Glu-tRNA(Gln) amidotransferase subunit D
LTPEHWKKVCEWIKEIEEREGNNNCYIDWKFDWDVKCLLTNPFFSINDYRNLFDKSTKGLVLLGYGAGNANVDEAENHNFNILPALKEAISQGKIIVISSQVPWRLMTLITKQEGDYWNLALFRLVHYPILKLR